MSDNTRTKPSFERINIKTVFFGSPRNSYLGVMKLEFIAEEINDSEDLNMLTFSCIMLKIG